MMNNYCNPFPPIGLRRVWRKEYIEKRKGSIDCDINWSRLGKLVSGTINNINKFPGIYAFVVKHPDAIKLPVSLDEVIYVGKSTNIKSRLLEYVSDKKEVNRISRRRIKVRDNIKIMFEEYGDSIEVYYAELPPDRIANIEDIYIQILDPILNSEQKLDKDKFESYENSIGASFSPVEKAFDTDTVNDDNLEPESSILSFISALGKPEDAF